jgi:hypothetical protein
MKSNSRRVRFKVVPRVIIPVFLNEKKSVDLYIIAKTNVSGVKFVFIREYSNLKILF